MWFHVDPSSGLPIYMQIISQVKRSVASGMLKEGDQMPSVRELATQLTVNPNTISKAYQELEREGVIKTSRGVGTFIAGYEVKMAREERVKLLIKAIDKVLVEAHHLGFSEAEMRDVFDTRIKDWKVKNK